MLYVLITVDVETSIGGAFAHPERLRPVGAEKRIYGRINGKEYGIPLIMEILEHHHLQGVFFVEPLCSYYFGEKMVREVCQYISSRGHEVQLHLHPNYQIFQYPDWPKRAKAGKLFPDILAKYSFEEQKKLIQKGKEILESCKTNPFAFRAGCFGANNQTLRALRENGFLFDSSFDLSMLNQTCFIKIDSINDLTKVNGIFETPVTNYFDFKLGKIKRLRHLDLCAISFHEARSVLQKALKYGMKIVTFILHSFSFLKKRDVQYQTAKPNKIVIKRFEKLCRYLSNNKNSFRVVTYKDLKKEKLEPSKVQVIPSGSNFLTLARYFSQAWQYLP